MDQVCQRLNATMKGPEVYETIIELTLQDGLWAQKGGVWEERRPSTNRLAASPASVTYNARGRVSRPSQKKGFYVSLTL